MPNIHSIAIASDHAGYSLKEMLCDYLKENDYEIENLGADSADSTDYNRFDVRLDARQSYIFTNAKISGSDNGDSHGAFVNFTTLKAKADTGTVDVELFLASS